jgi:hypothetical protein
MKRKYRDWGKRGPYKETRALIEQADNILQGYAFPLTLRQLFYKLVTTNTVANTPAEYKRLGNMMSDARYWGLIDWKMLIDRGRTVMEFDTYEDEAAAIDDLGNRFAVDRWADQPTRVEVWIEKDAAIGTIEAVCKEYQVPWSSTRGYHSTSGAKKASERLLRMMERQNVQVLHIADHDPSGVNMTDDLKDRIEEFLMIDAHGFGPKQTNGEWPTGGVGLDPDGELDITRLALTMPQVHTLVPRGKDGHPLSQVVKVEDPRAKAYQKQFGRKCWELDALEPNDLADIIRTAVVGLIDRDKWDAARRREAEAIENLERVGQDWTDVISSMNGHEEIDPELLRVGREYPVTIRRLARLEGQGL